MYPSPANPAVSTCSPVLAVLVAAVGARREWDIARHFTIVDRPLEETVDDHPDAQSNKMMAQQRPASHQITFQSLNRTFYIDVDDAPGLIAAGLHRETQTRPMVGRLLKVVESDGSTRVVEDPLARFMVREK